MRRLGYTSSRAIVEYSYFNFICIDSAPGSEKSTLTVQYICEEWGRGELFNEFTVEILIQL